MGGAELRLRGVVEFFKGARGVVGLVPSLGVSATGGDGAAESIVSCLWIGGEEPRERRSFSSKVNGEPELEPPIDMALSRRVPGVLAARAAYLARAVSISWGLMLTSSSISISR